MNEREMKMKKISEHAFAAWELTLYLDTHPHDMAAMEAFHKHNDEAKALTAAYENEYGPLRSSNTPAGQMWQWIESPWPWESSKEV